MMRNKPRVRGDVGVLSALCRALGTLCTGLGAPSGLLCALSLTEGAPGLTRGGSGVVAAPGWRVLGVPAGLWWLLANDAAWPSKPSSWVTSARIQVISYTGLSPMDSCLKWLHCLTSSPPSLILSLPYQVFLGVFPGKVTCAEVVISGSASGKPKLRQMMTPSYYITLYDFPDYITLSSSFETFISKMKRAKL